MSFNINNNKSEPKPNPKNKGILNRKIKNNQKYPKIYNFFFTKNYETSTTKKFNFFERNLLKLEYIPRNIIMTSIISISAVSVAAFIHYYDFYGPMISLSGRIPALINKKKNSAFLILDDHPYPFKYEDEEDGDLLSDEFLEHRDEIKREYGFSMKDMVTNSKNAKNEIGRPSPISTEENFDMNGIYLEHFGLKYDVIMEMFKNGETDDIQEELKFRNLDQRKIYNTGSWILPELPNELKWPPIENSNKKFKKFNVDENVFNQKEDILNKSEKRKILEFYQQKLRKQKDFQTPRDYFRLTRIENREYRFSGMYHNHSFGNL
eukprot:gene5976-9975_t